MTLIGLIYTDFFDLINVLYCSILSLEREWNVMTQIADLRRKNGTQTRKNGTQMALIGLINADFSDRTTMLYQATVRFSKYTKQKR